MENMFEENVKTKKDKQPKSIYYDVLNKVSRIVNIIRRTKCVKSKYVEKHTKEKGPHYKCETKSDGIPELVECYDTEEEDDGIRIIYRRAKRIVKGELATEGLNANKDTNQMNRSCDSQWGGCYSVTNNVLRYVVYVLYTLFMWIALTTSRLLRRASSRWVRMKNIFLRNKEQQE